jgi:hypothetical protein
VSTNLERVAGRALICRMWVRTVAARLFALAAMGLLGALVSAPALAQESATGAPSPAPGPGQTRPAKRAARGGRANSPDATMPGFETLADGSTRLFVELSQPIAYSAKVGHGAITYVLKGAHVDRRNNYNPLVTVHFNTPVASARLVPHGKDLWFVIALRANANPSVTMDATKEGGAVLRIEFAKGDYIPRAPVPPPSPTPAAAADDGEPADRPASSQTSEAPSRP